MSLNRKLKTPGTFISVAADRPLLEVERRRSRSHLFRFKFKGTVTHGIHGGVFFF